MKTTTEPLWRGFYRAHGGRWRLLTAPEGVADQGDAWAALLTSTRSLPAGDLLVTTKDPNAPVRPTAAGGRRLL